MLSRNMTVLYWFIAGTFFSTAIQGVAATAHGDNPGKAHATLIINAEANLAQVNGPHTTTAVTRDRYFRLYHFPGMYAGEVAAGLRGLNVAPGRGTGPYFGDDGGDKLRFGRGTTEEATIDKFIAMARRAAMEHPGSSYAAAGGSFPDFSAERRRAAAGDSQVEPTMKVGHSRAVAREDWPEVGAMLERWLKAMRQSSATLPTFFSPVNEPDASWKGGAGSSMQHAELVRNLALRFRESHPELRISGPCTAWPFPGEDWRRWGPQGWERAFIEKAGDVVGGYDFHFYTKELWAYGPESPGYKAERKLPTANLFANLNLGHPEIMDFGKADVLLDLVQAIHLAKWNTATPPLLISEFGRQGITPQLGPWANDYLYYLYATTVTRLWMGFMDRPEIALTVPFILPESDEGYGPLRGQALATRPGAPADMRTVVTPLADFIAFFHNFEGDRVPTVWQSGNRVLLRGLFAVAVRSDVTIEILMHNATPQAVKVGLELIGLDRWPEGAQVARMRWEGAIPTDHRTPAPESSTWRRDLAPSEILTSPELLLEPEETVLLRLPIAKPPTRQVVRSRLYAPEFLQPITPDSSAVVSFAITPENLTGAIGAELVLGFAAPTGLNHGRLGVSWSGTAKPQAVELGIEEGWRQIAVPVTIPIPVEDLTAGNWKVAVSDLDKQLPPGSRIVSARLDIQSELPITPPTEPATKPTPPGS